MSQLHNPAYVESIPQSFGYHPSLSLHPSTSWVFLTQFEKKKTPQNSATHLQEVLLGQDTLLKYASYAEFDLASEVSSSCVNGVSLATYSI